MTPRTLYVRAVRAMDSRLNVILDCELSARAFAFYAPPSAVERYVAECARAARAFRARQFVINLISLFVPYALAKSLDTVAGVCASMLFLLAWGVYGMWACNIGNVTTWARDAVIACERLSNAAKAASFARAAGDQS